VAYALYFTDGGDLWLKSDVDVTVEWLHAPSSRWHAPLRLASENGRVHLVTPQYTGYWAAYIVP